MAADTKLGSFKQQTSDAARGEAPEAKVLDFDHTLEVPVLMFVNKHSKAIKKRGTASSCVHQSSGTMEVPAFCNAFSWSVSQRK